MPTAQIDPTALNKGRHELRGGFENIAIGNEHRRIHTDLQRPDSIADSQYLGGTQRDRTQCLALRETVGGGSGRVVR